MVVNFNTRIPSFETIIDGDSLVIPYYNQIAIIPNIDGVAIITNSANETITVTAPIVFGANTGGFENWSSITIEASGADIQLIVNGDVKVTTTSGSGGGATFGAISGTPSAQTNLQEGTIQGVFATDNNDIVTGDTFKEAFQKTQGQLDVKLQQGGNSFGATIIIGTDDLYDLLFETNNVSRGGVDSSGKWMFGLTTPIANSSKSNKSYGNTSSSWAEQWISSADEDLMALRSDGYLGLGTTSSLDASLTIFNETNNHFKLRSNTIDRFNMYVDNATEDVYFDTINASLIFQRSGADIFSFTGMDTNFYQRVFVGKSANEGLNIDKGNQGGRMQVFVSDGSDGLVNDEGYIQLFNSALHVRTGSSYANEFIFTQIGDFEVKTVGQGVVVPSPDGTQWRLTPSNAGATIWTAI